jgi:hypothetical protein
MAIKLFLQIYFISIKLYSAFILSHVLIFSLVVIVGETLYHTLGNP